MSVSEDAQLKVTLLLGRLALFDGEISVGEFGGKISIVSIIDGPNIF
jgi:hypothetical protein